MTRPANPLKRFIGFLLGIYRGLRSVVLNLLFLLLLFVLLSPLLPQPRLPVPSGVALLVNPAGTIVEQYTRLSPQDQLLNRAAGNQNGEVLVSDLVRAISQAADDERINSLVIRTDALQGGGFTALRDIGDALDSFRASGKTIYAWGGSYSQAQYYLASHADEIIVNPLGGVELQGFGAWQLYYRDALDKLGVKAHIFRVGEYKAAVEPFERNDMSPAAEENYSQFLGELWQIYLQDVAANRSMDAAQLSDYSMHMDSHLADSMGDAALAAQTAGLVDRVAANPETMTYLQQQIGKDGQSFKNIDFNSYLQRTMAIDENGRPDQIGLIIASGEIVDGNAAPGTIGSTTLSDLIRKARMNDSIKALVLRVDSPGGSAFASEVIREELQAFRASGRPLVVSMGNVAASGGYWISTAADEIWASPSTITGSIGIYGVLPTFEDSLKKIGISVDGVGTSPLSGAGSIGKPLDPVVANTLQSTIEYGYQRFLTLVAESRDMSTDEVDEIAQGRVWSGQMAYQLGLVDQLGSRQDAIEAAAGLADIDDYSVIEMQAALTPLQQLINELLENDMVSLLLPDQQSDIAGLTRGPHLQQAMLGKLQQRLTDTLRRAGQSGSLLHCVECVSLEIW